MHLSFLNKWPAGRLPPRFPGTAAQLNVSHTHLMGVFLIPPLDYFLQWPWQRPLDVGVSVAPQADEG